MASPRGRLPAKVTQDFDEYGDDDYEYYYEDYDEGEDEDVSRRPATGLKDLRAKFRFKASSIEQTSEESSGESGEDTFKFRLVKDDSRTKHKSHGPVPLAVFGPQDYVRTTASPAFHPTTQLRTGVRGT